MNSLLTKLEYKEKSELIMRYDLVQNLLYMIMNESALRLIAIEIRVLELAILKGNIPED